MCGIAGILSGSPDLHAHAAAAMGAALAHRGPDDSGFWSSPLGAGEPVSLVHRRLAIQDLSPGGHQPMVSACGRYVLVFNGEIYNQHALRRDLERQGHRFRSSSDTEVLLQLLIRYGTAALQRLRGMYAFCLWDSHEQRALLARDPFGIKPLYLWQSSGGQLLFASEVRALLASNLIPRQLDANSLAGFLVSGSVPGHKGCWVEISDAVKASLPEDVPFPAGVRGGFEPAAEEEPAEVAAEEVVAEEAPADAPDAAEDNDEKKE